MDSQVWVWEPSSAYPGALLCRNSNSGYYFVIHPQGNRWGGFFSAPYPDEFGFGTVLLDVPMAFTASALGTAKACARMDGAPNAEHRFPFS